eukprot:g25668.t1
MFWKCYQKEAFIHSRNLTQDVKHLRSFYHLDVSTSEVPTGLTGSSKRLRLLSFFFLEYLNRKNRNIPKFGACYCSMPKKKGARKTFWSLLMDTLLLRVGFLRY